MRQVSGLSNERGWIAGERAGKRTHGLRRRGLRCLMSRSVTMIFNRCLIPGSSIVILCLPLLFAGCAGERGARESDLSGVTPPPTAGSFERGDLPSSVHSFETDPTGTGPTVESGGAVENSDPDRVAATASPPRRESAKASVAEPSRAASASGPVVTRYVNASGLNVRSAAGTSSRTIDQLAHGTRVTVRGSARDAGGLAWSKIEYRSNGRPKSGWVATNYLSADLVTETRVENSGDFAELHYEPVPKPEYPGNPRVDARAVYVSLNVLSSSRFDDILAMIDATELNALVLDYKDDVGWLLTRSDTAARLNPAANEKAKYDDITGLIQRLKARNIYLIARIVTFKDPLFAKTHPEKAIMDNRTGAIFKSGDGLSWASPHDADFRAYNLGIATEAARAGFNEIQFDYIRFPDVPRTASLNYRNPGNVSKAAAVQSFLLEARRELELLKVYLAADVFGLVTTTKDDMRIGQYWEAVSNAVDYICPMVYPSHYANGSYGLGIPDQHPYELIDRTLGYAIRRDSAQPTPAKIRPWLQGFTATWVKGHINYGPAQIKAQIKAAADRGIESYLIWHPSGRYNEAAYR